MNPGSIPVSAENVLLQNVLLQSPTCKRGIGPTLAYASGSAAPPQRTQNRACTHESSTLCSVRECAAETQAVVSKCEHQAIPERLQTANGPGLRMQAGPV